MGRDGDSGVPAMAVLPAGGLGLYLAVGLAILAGCPTEDDATPEPGELVIRPERISAGYSHTLLLQDDGKVSCWGADSAQQCDVGIQDGTTFVQVTANNYFSCALREDGFAHCFGTNAFGEISDIPWWESFTQIGAGYHHVCGIRPDGTLYCWGCDEDGQADPPDGTFIQVSAGSNHTCGLNPAGGVQCWGCQSYNYGQCDPPEWISLPVIQISAGRMFTVALSADGSMSWWGIDDAGQLHPDDEVELERISAGFQHSCGLGEGGAAVCWGLDEDGQASTPPGSFEEVSAGGAHTCGILSGGGVRCWGANDMGQLDVP